MVQIPEYIVIEAWNAVDKDENSGFGVVLKAAKEYRKAGMTPFFILDKDKMNIICVAKETFGKVLH